MKLSTIYSGLAAATLAHGKIVLVDDFKGLGLSQRKMYIHQSDSGKKLDAKAPILVMLHGCTQGANNYYTSTPVFRRLAEEKFHIIYPDTRHDSSCWDVGSTASLTHDGGSDSKNIMLMVEHYAKTRGGNPEQVYVVGTSSGAMMANVLAATYPDVLKGASAFSGVPAGCLAQSTCSEQSPCSGLSSDKSKCSGFAIQGARDPKFSRMTAAQWGDVARKAYPGYNGPRPKMMIWHGTADMIVTYPNLADALKQWSNVLGVETPANATNTPQSGYTKIAYGDGTKLVGYSAAGVGHVVSNNNEPTAKEVLKFFGV